MSKRFAATPRQILDWNINDKLGSDCQADIRQVTLSLPKDMDLTSIQKAYQVLLERHNILRTHFPMINGKVVQKVEYYDPEIFLLLELNSHSQYENITARKEAIGNLKDIKNAPLLHSAVICEDTRLVFVMLIHNMICDVWSKKIILEELETLCYQFHSNTYTKLESNVVQLGNFYEKNEKLINNTEKVNLIYWRNELSDKSWQVDFNKIYYSCLGSESGNIKVKKFRGWQKLNFNAVCNSSKGYKYLIHINGELYEKLKIFCLETCVGVNSVLMGCMSVLGMNLTGNESILIRMNYHGRDNNTKTKIIGNLLGCLLLSFKIKKSDRCKDTILNYYDSFSRAVNKIVYNSEELETLQVTARCFSSFNFIGKELAGDGPVVIPEAQTVETLSIWCPLHCSVTEYTNTILLSCAYNSNYYDFEVITSMFNIYFELLQYMVSYPEKELKAFGNKMEMF